MGNDDDETTLGRLSKTDISQSEQSDGRMNVNVTEGAYQKEVLHSIPQETDTGKTVDDDDSSEDGGNVENDENLGIVPLVEELVERTVVLQNVVLEAVVDDETIEKTVQNASSDTVIENVPIGRATVDDITKDTVREATDKSTQADDAKAYEEAAGNMDNPGPLIVNERADTCSPSPPSPQPSDETVECKICNVKLKNRFSLNAHIRSHKRKDYHCKVCNLMYRNRFQLNSHMRVHKKPATIHIVPPSGKFPDTPSSVPTASSPEDLPLPPRLQNRKNYHSLHHGPTIRIWEKKRKLSTDKEESIDEISTSLPSKISRLTSSPKPRSRSPITVHDRPLIFKMPAIYRQPFRCSRCFYAGQTQICLDLHVQLAHVGLVSHRCTFCWKSFPNSERLSEHTTRTHLVESTELVNKPVEATQEEAL